MNFLVSKKNLKLAKISCVVKYNLTQNRKKIEHNNG